MCSSLSTGDALVGNQYNLFWHISREAIEDAISHLAEMSTVAPLRTGDFYIKRSPRIGQEAPAGASVGILDDKALMTAWASLVATFDDKPRLSTFLKTCRKEWQQNGEDVSLTIYTKNEIQANWIREKLLPEIKSILASKLAFPTMTVIIATE